MFRESFLGVSVGVEGRVIVLDIVEIMNRVVSMLGG